MLHLSGMAHLHLSVSCPTTGHKVQGVPSKNDALTWIAAHEWLTLPVAKKTTAMEKEIMKYTTYFYEKSRPTGSDFCSNPTQEFYSLEEARTFSRHAADTGQIAKVRSFRIETGDGKISEHWIRDTRGWKLIC
jgi:hypothetical protein